MIISASERLACTVMLLHLFAPYSFSVILSQIDHVTSYSTTKKNLTFEHVFNQPYFCSQPTVHRSLFFSTLRVGVGKYEGKKSCYAKLIFASQYFPLEMECQSNHTGNSQRRSVLPEGVARVYNYRSTHKVNVL